MKTKIFIENAVKVHGLKYDYSLVEYKNSRTKVKIICKEHGVFEQIPNNHIRGAICLKCSCPQLTTEQFVEKSIQKHGLKYDYSMVEYVDTRTKVKIICKEHGVFEQTSKNHIDGHGCSKCSGVPRRTNDEYKNAAAFVHKNEYSYDKTIFTNTHKYVVITCKKHGDFKQKAYSHLNGRGCPKCANHVSKPEIEVFDFIKTLTQTAVQSNRSIIKPKELDIYCESDKIAVEFNGLYWHSSKKFETHLDFKDKHSLKSVECSKLGIRLFHIFENEWNYKKEIWKSILTRAFNKAEFKHVTSSKKISKTDSIKFFKKNSLENTLSDGIGYYSDNELIAVYSEQVLVHKLYTSSDIKPDLLKINLRTPETVLEYKLLEEIGPQPHFHDSKKFIKYDNIFMSYANELYCIWDCGYKIYGKI